MKPVRTILAGAALGFAAGLAGYVAGLMFFPAAIWGEAALTYSDGEGRFYDRDDSWELVPLAGTTTGVLLAALRARGPRRRLGAQRRSDGPRP